MIYESLMQQTKLKFDIAAFASLEKFTFYSKLDIKVPKYLLILVWGKGNILEWHWEFPRNYSVIK